ncbi:MAG: hypothetical protein ABR518_04730, partial [Actinomycetota bacterium]
MELTPVQQRTLDELMGRAVARPVFAQDLAERLRTFLRGELERLPLDRPLWLSKHRLNDLGRCEGLFNAGLVEEHRAFEYRAPVAVGSVAHKAIELDVPRRRRDAVPTLVDRATELLRAADGAFARYWSGLDP